MIIARKTGQTNLWKSSCQTVSGRCSIKKMLPSGNGSLALVFPPIPGHSIPCHIFSSLHLQLLLHDPMKPSTAGAMITAASAACLFRKLINANPDPIPFQRTFPETLCCYSVAAFTVPRTSSLFCWNSQTFFCKIFCCTLCDMELQLQKLQSQDPVHFSYHVPGCRCYRRYLLLRCKYHSHPHRLLLLLLRLLLRLLHRHPVHKHLWRWCTLL